MRYVRKAAMAVAMAAGVWGGTSFVGAATATSWTGDPAVAGNYLDPTQWSNGVANNTATTQYDATINGRADLTGADVVVDSLTLGPTGVLSVRRDVEANQFRRARYEALGASTVNGQLNVGASGVLFRRAATFGSTANVGLGGRITPDYDPANLVLSAGGSLAAGGQIRFTSSGGGTGVVTVLGGDFVSDGTLLAGQESDADINVSPGATFWNRGRIGIEWSMTIKGAGFRNTGTIDFGEFGEELYLDGVPVENLGTIDTSEGGTVHFIGTLAGNGTVTGETDLANTTVSPGNSVGQISFTGGATFRSSTTYDAELAAGGFSDLISITGNFAPNNAILDLSGGVLGESYVIATWTGTRTGAFAAVPATYQVAYDDVARQARVTLVPEPTGAALFATMSVLASLARRRSRRSRNG